MSDYKTCSKCGFLYPVGSMSTDNSKHICQGCTRPKSPEQPIEPMHPSVELRHAIEELTSLRNQLAEAQKTNERLLQQQIEQRRKLGAEADDWKLKFDNAVKYATEREQERDQLKQQLAALTEALKPVRVEHNQSPCPIAESVSQKVIQRAHVGFKKYGTNAARTDLSLNDWLNHLQEELLDAAVYVERLKRETFTTATVREALGMIAKLDPVQRPYQPNLCGAIMKAKQTLSELDKLCAKGD